MTSAFKGKSKIGPLKKLLNNPKYQAPFRLLGDEWTVLADNKSFTCMMYGHPRENFINAARETMLRKMVGENEEFATKSNIYFPTSHLVRIILFCTLSELIIVYQPTRKQIRISSGA